MLAIQININTLALLWLSWEPYHLLWLLVQSYFLPNKTQREDIPNNLPNAAISMNAIIERF